MPRPRTKPEPRRVLAEGACPHHWIIEPAKGATSKGVCRLCGAVKSFNNSMDYDVFKTLPSQGGTRRPKMPDLTVSRRPRWNDGF